MEGQLRFAQEYGRTKYQLMEVPEEVLSHLEAGESLYEILGKPENEARLVSPSKTFTVRAVESSNTQLLVPCPGTAPSPGKRRRVAGAEGLDSKGGAVETRDGSTKSAPEPALSIQGSVSMHLQLNICRPSPYKTFALLRERPLGDDEDAESGGAAEPDEPPAEGRVFSFDQLLTELQISARELRAHMRFLDAVEIGGKVRVLYPQFADDLVEFVLATVEIKGWPWSKVPVSACVAEIKSDYPRPLVEQALRRLSAGTIDGDVACLDATKVCAFKAELILRKNNPCPESLFLESWAKIVPDVFTPDVKMLKGVALLQHTPSGKEWRYVSHLSLPLNAEARLAALFALQPSWPLEDLRPYMNELRGHGQTLEELVLLHARDVDGKIVPAA